MKSSHVYGLAAAVFAVATSSVAHAQPVERLRQGVAERDRPAYAARGMRAGQFLLYPSVDVSLIHDDNIFVTDNNKVDDWLVQTTPELRVESNFPVHAVYFDALARNQLYFDNNSENRTDYSFAGGGRLDIRRVLNFNVDARYERLSEDRGSPDAVGAATEPVRYDHTEVNPELRYLPGRLSVRAGAVYENYQFDNVGLIGGGFQNNKDRDRTVLGGYGRVGFEVSPGYEFFVQGLYNDISYDRRFDDNIHLAPDGTFRGFIRDSHGYEVDLGAKFELTNVLSGEASVGYISRSFDEIAFSTASGVASAVSLDWYVTRLTTVTFGVSRKIQETTLFGSSSYMNTVIDVGVDHELLRNLVVSASARYDMRKYENIGRDDKNWEGRLRAQYLLNRNFSVGGEYRYGSRQTNALGEDFSKNMFLLTFRGQI